ncbi:MULTISPECIES: LysM peptidoglycan-binding domain-containing protein [unclassified Bradyrhizobium]|uniref:LysM peptidoglycan-binding domain-containing protein n=1 Tax=unclassified Bradyrhizobium TaxID=2631580 RepID=UPI00211EA0E0|nr:MULTISPECIES: LysM peptidoglycan-binding domain-containing protein [unclassified Bradyrhizobium]MDD1536586.1 peptidoglycan-binding protein LysM [Bradyrhizobium sp. WBOS8]MDD1586328.1 peptidoglycan-binding protein LysM [Bradyrhizobium sp. WBOS4]UUO45958.1 peptidoglycan-binding protein LysM [Bradyrhizobium sp. WBOS04]UUO59662.1 peptidoglycan-binding protein LysM [Bradyrhizobium sp. WBOS08]
MITASKAFIAFCLLALVGTVLVIGPTELRRMLPDGAKTAIAAKPEAKPETKVEPKVEAKAELKTELKADLKPEPKPEQPKLDQAKPDQPKPDQPKLAAVAPPAPEPAPAAAPAPEPKPAPLAEIQKQVAALPDLAPVKPPAAAADTGPRFDVARVDDHGEAAVIAGRAAPGAKVELLRDGKPLDTVTADASGQFVMMPPQLPAGSYELMLRARAPDGTVTQSGRTMPVTIAEASPPPARPAQVARQETKPEIKQEPKQAEKADDKSDVVAALPSASPRLASAPDRPAPRPKPRAMARVPAATTTVASASPAEVLHTVPAEAGGSRVISRGDSLWALSRLAYGDGARYAVIFNANRDKISNPNLIYPGQTFVVPQKPE